MRAELGRVAFAATDLGDHLECTHLSALDLLVAEGKLDAPGVHDPVLDILAERGQAHEAAYLDHLRATGRLVVTAPPDANGLLDVLRSGPDVVYQAPLELGRWKGRADFLVRVENPSDLGAWSYEIADTKLSADVRAAALLQLCVYTDILGTLQGRFPARMHVIRPGAPFAQASFVFDEYAAIYRRIKASLELQGEARPATYPEPVPHCEWCRWRTRCDAQRRADDHPSLIAGLSRKQRDEFASRGAMSVREIAFLTTPLDWRPSSGGARSIDNAIKQARLQVTARESGSIPWEMLPPGSTGSGLLGLPTPDSGDVFLDFEGDPFIDSGREFLLGYLTFDNGSPTYRAFWGLDPLAERSSFEQLVDALKERCERFPSMHVYHYAPYEPAAIERLRDRHGTRIAEVDRLFRETRFVDVYALLRQAVRIGIESYGLKTVETVIGFNRELPLTETGPFHRKILLALMRGASASIDAAWMPPVESYNRDDCLGAKAVRDWLEARRAELVAHGAQLPRPAATVDAPARPPTMLSEAVEKLATRIELAPEPERAPSVLLLNLVGWYAREARVTYAEAYRRAEYDLAALLDDPKCVGGLEHVARVPGRGSNSIIDQYRFPPQEVQAQRGDSLIVRPGEPFGTVDDVDLDARIISVRRRITNADTHPTSAIVWESVPAGTKEQALISLATEVGTSGIDSPQVPSLARDLLRGIAMAGLAAPGQPACKPDEDSRDAALRLALQMSGAIVPIQGPPGTGKTELSARMIMQLVRAGKRIGITATSHKVIQNLVERVAAQARADQFLLRCLLKNDDDHTATAIPSTTDASEVERRVRRLHLVGATAWQWSREAMKGSVDVLFIDEAGQMALADAVAVAGCASAMVLVGDPQQLQQPAQASHPAGASDSCLKHVIGGDIVSEERGIFLRESYRLPPSIATFTSAQFYEQRLKSAIEDPAEPLASLNGPGLFLRTVAHSGNQNRSDEEVDAVVALGEELLADRALSEDDILVVAPYNAHVAALRDGFARAGRSRVRIGTVDRFQGQEARIAIYSMATSSSDVAPRGLAFLFDRHRLNVATSRARYAAILVCSEHLLRTHCRTVEELRLLNPLCRFAELATNITPRS